MKWESLKNPANARKVGNALAIVVVLALVSLWLEWKAEWPLDQILSSLASFVIVALAILLRFASRGRTAAGETDELWMTALWTGLVGGVAWIVQKVAERASFSASAYNRRMRRRRPYTPPRSSYRQWPGRYEQ